MGKKKLILFATGCIVVLIVSIVFINYDFLQSNISQSSVPDLSKSDFVVYQQVFNWSRIPIGSHSTTRYTFWNLTSLESGLANIQVLDYDIAMPTNDNFTYPQTQANLKVNMTTRQVIDVDNLYGSVGSSIPYWVSSTLKQGDEIQINNTEYRNNNNVEILHIMGQDHECWVISYAINSHQQNGLCYMYYDVKTGILLFTHTHITLRGSWFITIEERAIETNIVSINNN
jgi:hypothetical protein